MNLLSPIKEIMTSNVLSLNPDASISQAGKLFDEHKIHHVPITDDKGHLLGIVSKADYLFFRRGFLTDQTDERIEEIRMNNYDVTSIMTKGVATLEPTDKINVALEVFKENLFHAIPIVENKKLVGIVSTFDIINELAESNGAVAEYK